MIFRAAIFDMDGDVTRTTELHAAAWKELFDDLLRRRARDGEPYRPFDERTEYLAYVDGKPRREGLRSFLRARQITLGEEEEYALAGRKDTLFERRLREQGVQTFSSTLDLIRALRACGVKIGLVTSSRRGREVLAAAGIAALFDACLDGIDLGELALAGKPDPAAFLQSAQSVGAAPSGTLVFEDAVVGVKAGRRGGFGLVVGGGPRRQRCCACARRRGSRGAGSRRAGRRSPGSSFSRAQGREGLAYRAGRLRPRP
ncbi:MAG TPA: HAD-IA family hydrolase [Burkholderiaceae bacterium]|nr:HAD-IA family hydrolase [Burkholderiaceae bacterium]